MKLLDYPSFAGLKACMAGRTETCMLSVHLSCFSLKTDATETRLFKTLERATAAAQERQRDRALSFSSLPGGQGDQSPARHHMDISEAAPQGAAAAGPTPPALDLKTLCHLISALNTSFVDFDFSCVAPCPALALLRQPVRSSPPPPPAQLPPTRQCTPIHTPPRAGAAERAALCAWPAWTP